MINFFRAFSIFRFVWVPLSVAGILYFTHTYYSAPNTINVTRLNSKDEVVAVQLSKLWVEGTYRSVGLGASEGLQSESHFIYSPKPLHRKNPVTDYALHNNLSIACLQMDGIWSYKDKEDIFSIEGNITFKGDHPFNIHLNNSVLYTKSFYLREGNTFSLMSTSIRHGKPRGEYKSCSNDNISATRNIRFDNYLEQMNSLTYPSGYLAGELDSTVGYRKNSQTSYITNAQYVARMKNKVPLLTETNKSAKSAENLFVSLLSIPGILNANKSLRDQSEAIDADQALANTANDDYAYALDIRVQYLTRMADALNCEHSDEYQEICSLGGSITYKKNKIIQASHGINEY
jgi:hypothetical protein